MEGVRWRTEPILILLMGALVPLLLPPGVSATFRLPGPWGWACVNETCVKQENTGVRIYPGLNTCKLTCGPFGSLWPRPTGVTRVGNETANFLLEKLILEGIRSPTEEVKGLVTQAFDLFKGNVAKELPEGGSRPEQMGPHQQEVLNREVRLDITVSGAVTRLSLETPEAYTLDITPRETVISVTILASNYFGARHALETLSQLIAFDDQEGLLQIVSSAALTDSPAFKYRGILLDTSRNFFSVKSIERTLDAMAANKLNTFHWHITDSHSFPMFLESLPKMAFYGAYSSRQVYYPTDILHLVEYGRVRGIRVLPEFDAPAHVGNGWQWGEADGLGKLAVCVNQEPWQSYCVEPPCGQLNIVNDNTYIVLGQIYKEMVRLFGPLDLFHYGGDEVNLNCWNTTEEIVKHMEEQGRGRDADAYYKLWSDFQASSYGLLTTANSGRQIPGILWTSHLTEEGRADQYLDKDHYIIQIWTTGTDKLIGELLQKKFRVIFSNYDHWYLDCGFGAWVGEGNNWCSPYKGWQKVYDNSPHAIATNLTGSLQADLILGGEAALWSEQVDEMTLDSRLWPRGAALAERLWTNPSHNWQPAETRLIHQRQRLVARGIKADRIQPQWCHQNEGLCYI
ncbi:chitooligosaccharidolytic beta-N-acetylglucosaminidase-like [Penaeus chinensis]|uniref:chitooligosaccharidolytic beta-N-acetylglucosaminidase-like n=1 Tax=Penaeus chinensis TaxID=139456 RepID=UPI001FB74D1B|nr:chitooligosaccharidolytic beta-N-acetylglucosaminidase-like [Penaeus chinensis]XP_047476583.1 chitooligosaccharidolytic beta-N-acetylglucosaminidase-like [Penaeus chinensis]XP_047476592.1 chitooligosaccharidolytic beta-N-acetylglucosaminidase-like [Penaeus chinensis]XP_047476601.1 chitooligosaccharidolytic beta-N-acetylglucosaminidase-like [Penaeus chinensis]XP_047476610.1 chitooligosaccharidolytic beta-N-acetylglucosaminidase-like [Penaeus chinensis]